MRFKRPIYRILFYTAWIVVIGGIATLLVSANSKAKARTCKGVAVSINNGGDKIYVEKEDVLKSIQHSAHGSVVHRHTGDINLAELETDLETNPWIRDAELYFDTKDILHVAVSERVPVARVFTTAGTSFYIDTTGCRMPLLEAYSAKLPVITGFALSKRRNAADSLLVQEIKEVVQTVSADAFWNAQIGQIDITPDRKFELIPVIGSHVIKLGSGNQVKEKLAKLLVFYKQVLPKAGFAKYSALDVQFDGQVVAVRRGPVSAVDSVQLQKNIQELLEKKLAEQEPQETAPAVVEPSVQTSGDIEEPITNTKDSVVKTAATSEKPAVQEKPMPVPAKRSTAAQAVVPKSTPKKSTQQSKPVRKPAAAKRTAVSKPKAVMPKRVANEY
ncbi:MAG TPA: hypothetical protein VFL47_17710 [Flavisolibacter sp.]|nr:hypothetical protein [Flavisolibacter sp.]